MRGHNSLRPLHAFNAQESTINNVGLIKQFEQRAGHCGGYALRISRVIATPIEYQDPTITISRIRIAYYQI